MYVIVVSTMDLHDEVSRSNRLVGIFISTVLCFFVMSLCKDQHNVPRKIDKLEVSYNMDRRGPKEAGDLPKWLARGQPFLISSDW